MPADRSALIVAIANTPVTVAGPNGAETMSLFEARVLALALGAVESAFRTRKLIELFQGAAASLENENRWLTRAQRAERLAKAERRLDRAWAHGSSEEIDQAVDEHRSALPDMTELTDGALLRRLRQLGRLRKSPPSG